MIFAQLSNYQPGLAPISLNSAANTPLVVDTKGYAYAVFTVQFGVIGGAATVMRVTECATTNGTYTAITGLTASGATGDGRLPQTTDAGKAFKFYLPITGARKRYLNCEITTGATTLVSVGCDLSRAEQSPNSTSELGLAGYLLLS